MCNAKDSEKDEMYQVNWQRILNPIKAQNAPIYINHFIKTKN